MNRRKFFRIFAFAPITAAIPVVALASENKNCTPLAPASIELDESHINPIRLRLFDELKEKFCLEFPGLDPRLQADPKYPGGIPWFDWPQEHREQARG